MGTTRRLVKTCVLFLVLIGSASVHAQERDLWYVMTQDETPITSSHVLVTSSGDGALHAWVSRVPVNFMGRHQEITVTTEFLVAADLHPLSMSSETAGTSGTTTIRGELVDNVLTVTSTADGETSTTVSTVADDHPVLIDSCVGEWLARQPPETTVVTLQVIDESTWEVETVTATAQTSQESGRSWRVEYEDATWTMTLQLGADGFETERFYENAGLRMTRCSKEEAESIAPNEQTGAAVLSFPVEPPIPAPHLLTNLTVELRWKDIALEDFELEDDRQRLLEHSQDEEGFRALVNISAPEPVESDLPFPVQEEGLEQFLAETDYIKPHHADIRRVALEVSRGKRTALEAVQALSTWVYEYIDGALIVETLSGPQVLARKTGKCTEYSTLFASLARSVGIPTRMALGERMVGGQWGGHMWNEAWVGRWIPVDASADEVGTSFALLKFIHSDTVAGTQPLRHALPASLAIRVQGFETRDAALAGQYETGIEGSVYTSVDFECRVTAPRPEWQLHDDSGSGNATIRFEIPGAESTFVHFVAFGLPPGTPAKTLTDSRIELFRPNYEDFEVTKNEPVTVREASGHTTSFRGFAKGSEVESTITEVVWTQGSFGFILNMIATKAEHDANLAEFEELLAGFEFLAPR